ncbi:hypothetical protein CHL9752_08900 [Campylobacter hyointestinalis subsp. lawsonii]|nr:MerR family DNA-binding transcriptional regulator [Campylobacter hyointestinalis]RAZ22579.1 hypothetical protein CHL9752_08900 [Campylobacter hyointestinalis subsp. lawsonii]
MAYTIIEVSKKTGVSPRTLRYWCDNGLFPLIERSFFWGGVLGILARAI